MVAINEAFAQGTINFGHTMYESNSKRPAFQGPHGIQVGAKSLNNTLYQRDQANSSVMMCSQDTNFGQ